MPPWGEVISSLSTMDQLTDRIQEFDNMLETIDDEVMLTQLSLSNIASSALMVSTMTILFKTTCNHDKSRIFPSIMIDLPYGEGDYQGVLLRKKKEGKLSFLNCIIFEVTKNTHKKVVVKLFSNGSLHCTGAKTVEDAKKGADVICELYQKQVDMLSERNRLKHFNIVDFDIQMINSNFSIDTPLNLDATKDILNQKYSMDATLNREHHPGIIIKYRDPQLSKPVSIIVFISGSIIITGAKCAKDLTATYQHITNILDSNMEDIRLKTPYVNKKNQPKGIKKRGRKKKNELQEFYNDFKL